MAAQKYEATGVSLQNVGTANFYGSINVHAGSQGTETRETDIPTSTVFNPRAGGYFLRRLMLSGYCVSRFRKVINVGSWDRIVVKITENYTDEDLSEPGFDVYPQMRKGIRFYKGEYAKEEGFSITSPANRGQLVTPEDLAKEISEGDSRIIAVVGQAGSGKTTILKRIARSIMVANELSERQRTARGVFARLFRSSKKQFKLVYYANIKDLSTSTTSVPELLFGKSRDLDKNSLSHGYDWILQNESQVIFFLDGLDQAPWDIEGKHEEMDSWDIMSTAAIMNNLILGNILNHVKVVISSREHRIATLPRELRPQLIVSLAGLSGGDAQKLFSAVMGDDGEKEWVEMCKTSPTLVRLSSVPLFLIFNAIVRKHCQVSKRDPPDSMTGIMCHILEILPSSNHTMTAEKITEVMQRLRPMAYEGMKEKRVTFTVKDLEKHGLQIKEVQDLIVKVPRSNMLAYRIVEAGCNFFFAHQTIHEMLAAEFCALMAISEFKQYLIEFCHEDHWSVVRKFLCGILVNAQLRKQVASKLLNEHEIDEKKDLLKRSLDQHLRETTDQLHILELLGSLYEANDTELINSHVKEISFNGIPLTPDSMHTVSSIMRRCDHLSVFQLINCNINEELMNILKANTKNHNMQIEILEFGAVAEQTTRLFIAIAKFATQCQAKELHMKPWSVLQLEEDEIVELSECTVYGKVKILNIGGIVNETSSLFIAIAKIVTSCQVDEVRMKPWSYLNINSDELTELSKWRFCGKVGALNIGGVVKETSSLFIAIAKIVTCCQADEVRMKPWSSLRINRDEVMELTKLTTLGKAEILDLGEIGESTFQFFIAIASVATRCQSKEVWMKPWSALQLGEYEVMELSKWTVCGKAKILDLPAIEEGNSRLFVNIATVATRCQAKEVRMNPWSFVKLGKEEVMELSKCTAFGKVEILGFGEIARPAIRVFIAIAKVAQHCQAKEVQMKPWSFLQLGKHEIVELSKYAVFGKVEILNISTAVKETSGFFIAIAKIATSCQANQVQMKPWSSLHLNRRELMKLSKWTICGKVDILDLGEIEESTLRFFITIASIAARCQAKEVRMKPWSVLQLGEEEIMELSQWTVCGKAEVLDLDAIEEGNSTLFVNIAIVATRCQATEVRMKPWSFVTFGLEEIMDLSISTACGKVEILGFDDVGNKANCLLFIAICKVAARCQAKEVQMKPWPFLVLGEDEVMELSEFTVFGKIEILNISATIKGTTRSQVFTAVAKIATSCQAREVQMEPWPAIYLDRDELMELSKWAICGKVEKFKLGHDITLNPEVCKALGCVVRQCGIEDLQIWLHGLTAEYITAFQEGICDGKFKRWDLGGNETMGPEGCQAVGRVVRQCGVEDLKMSECGLRAEHITAFQEGIGDGKFKTLDLNWNGSLKPEGCKAIGCVVRQCGVENLLLRRCNLTPEQIFAFLEGIGDGKFKRWDLSWNSLNPECCRSVGYAVRQCGVEDLDMESCNLEAKHIIAFKEGIFDGKVTRLNISLTRFYASGHIGHNVKDDFIEALIGLLKHCKVKHLSACWYNFKKHGVGGNQRRRLRDAAEKFGTELDI